MRKKKKTSVTVVTVRFGLPDAPYREIRRTRKARRNKIKEFLNYLACFETTSLAVVIRVPFIMRRSLFKLLDAEAKDHKKRIKPVLQKRFSKDFDDLFDWLLYNQVIHPTMRLCREEFLVYISELQAAIYSGAARTLRCILETGVEACVFQAEESRLPLPALIKEYYSLINREKSKNPIHSLLTKHNAWVAFMERYRIYEKTKRIAPSFKELVNDLNSVEAFQECPQTSNEIKTVYEALSDYVHPSSAKFGKLLAGKKLAQQSFNAEEFDTIYDLGLKILDIVQFLYLKSMSSFFGFPTSKGFLNELAEEISLDPALAKFFLTLPFSKTLSEQIKWSARKKKPSKSN